MALKDGLIGVWCEGADPVTDQHTNGLTLTNIGIGAAAGKVGTAGDFEKDDEFVLSLDDEALLSTGNISFTVAAWVQLESIASNANIGSKGTEYTFQFRTTGAENRFRFYIANLAVGVAATTFGLPSTATWYYVQAQHDASGDLVRIRVNDGAWDEQATGGTAPTDGLSDFCIGGVGIGGSGISSFWDGLVNQYTFWKALKSDADLNAIFNAANGLAFSSWDAGGGGASIVPQMLHHHGG